MGSSTNMGLGWVWVLERGFKSQSRSGYVQAISAVSFTRSPLDQCCFIQDEEAALWRWATTAYGGDGARGSGFLNCLLEVCFEYRAPRDALWKRLSLTSALGGEKRGARRQATHCLPLWGLSVFNWCSPFVYQKRSIYLVVLGPQAGF